MKLLEVSMRPVKRGRVHKAKSARRFRRNSGRTHPKNMAGPMRGGIRL